LFDSESVVVAVSADLGEKYLDTIYSPDWINASYGVDGAMIESGAEPACREPLRAVIARHNPARFMAVDDDLPGKSSHRYDADRSTS
jgi:hypothetical protein